MESLVSELARIMGGERAHIQECGDSILKAYASQACLKVLCSSIKSNLLDDFQFTSFESCGHNNP